MTELTRVVKGLDVGEKTDGQKVKDSKARVWPEE